MFTEMGFYQEATKVRVDNTAAITIAKNEVTTDRNRHIAIRHLWVRDLVQAGEVNLEYVRTNNNPADFLTKILPAPRFRELRDIIMQIC